MKQQFNQEALVTIIDSFQPGINLRSWILE